MQEERPDAFVYDYCPFTAPEGVQVDCGFIDVPDTPGLGIESLNDEVIAEHLDPTEPGLWEPTEAWDSDFSNDRLWS